VSGGNALQTCTDNSDCPGGSCEGNCPGGACHGICADDVSAVCVGGSNTDAACTTAVCVAGVSPGLTCTSDANCDDACVGGTNAGDECADAGDCPGGACSNLGTCGAGICTGGASQGAICTMDADCPSSTCTTTDCPGGTCTAQGEPPVQPCPVCVDARFNPITDGSTGTCDLGASQGAACASTNSHGLTIDCAPDDELFLADLPITLDNLTTGQATMVADDDGTFCNFGFCVGGGRAGTACDNTAECEGGTCQKTCQGGLDANGDPLDGLPCQNDDQCAGLTQGVCGQPDPGAFIAVQAGGVLVRRIIESGQPAPAPITVGDVTNAKVGAVFCIPITPSKAINSVDGVPGPGAVALEGTVTVFGRCVGGANDGEYCLAPSDCPSGACGEPPS
jgi:hypothetical protein